MGAFIVIALLVVGGWVAYHSEGSNSEQSSQAQVSSTPTATATYGPSATPTHTPTPKPSPTPTHTPQWTTIQTFKGYGYKNTVPNVPNRWQLVWSCDPASDGGPYNLLVDVDSPDGNPVNPGAVLTTCQQGNTSDSTQEYQGGTFYLDVQCDAAWTIQIQVLK